MPLRRRDPSRAPGKWASGGVSLEDVGSGELAYLADAPTWRRHIWPIAGAPTTPAPAKHSSPRVIVLFAFLRHSPNGNTTTTKSHLADLCGFTR
jgi:hypothetical protein